tara:strand:- start:866 stop:1396 length:531 start_codon:yes stop_codon:yes gene_type:complete
MINDLFYKKTVKGGNTNTDNTNTDNTNTDNTDIGNLQNMIDKEANALSRMRDELESLRNNSNSLNELIKKEDSNSNYIKLNRSIIEDTNQDAIENIIQNDNNLEEEITDEITEEIEGEDKRVKEKITKPYENLCEVNYNEKKKKHKYDDLKLNLDTNMGLEPFNNDDFSEFGKFNC